ncbi:MAG: TetR/AcrR family transcriptional regulator [Brevinematales bacterium]|nr:TetR/AcrR family transcriptional regulator [Brevinematales bacterium]
MSENIKERIIFSAINLFADKGFHETKVDEIAKKSQVAKGTIYLYFKNKEDILKKSLEYILQKAIENYYIDNNKSFCENLKEILERNSNFALDNINFYKVMLSSVYKVNKSEEYKKRSQDFNQIVSKVKILLEKGLEEGIVRKDIDIDNLSILLTNLILSSMMNIVVMIVFGNDSYRNKVEDFIEDVYKFALSSVKGG